MNKKLRFIVESAIIAAIYATLTILLAPLSYGQIQVRVAEAMTVLPYFTTAAIPGLFTGCLIANVIGGQGWTDIIFGSLATLLAAIVTYMIPKSKRLLAPLPPVLFNGIIVGKVVASIYQLPLILTVAAVSAGEAIACYGLGLPLLKLLEKHKVFS